MAMGYATNLAQSGSHHFMYSHHLRECEVLHQSSGSLHELYLDLVRSCYGVGVEPCATM